MLVLGLVDLCLLGQDAPIVKAGRGSPGDTSMVEIIIQPIFEIVHQDFLWPVEMTSQVTKFLSILGH